jgi:hypothetical protein
MGVWFVQVVSTSITWMGTLVLLEQFPTAPNTAKLKSTNAPSVISNSLSTVVELAPISVNQLTPTALTLVMATMSVLDVPGLTLPYLDPIDVFNYRTPTLLLDVLHLTPMGHVSSARTISLEQSANSRTMTQLSDVLNSTTTVMMSLFLTVLCATKTLTTCKTRSALKDTTFL